MAQFYKPKKQNVKRGKSIDSVNKDRSLPSNTSLTISTQDQNGQGICLSTKPITIVENALIGEVCEVRFTKTSKRVNFAYASKIIQAHESRVEPFCEYYAQCGGCSMQHTSAEFALEQKNKALQSFLNRQHQINATSWQSPVHCAAINTNFDNDDLTTTPNAYRRRIRLAIDARNPKNIRIGFRMHNSQKVIDIQKCAVALAPINKVLPALTALLKTLPSVKRIGHIVMTLGDELDNNIDMTTNVSAPLQVAIHAVKPLCDKSVLSLTDFARKHNVAVVLNSKSDKPVLLNTDTASTAVTINKHITQLIEAEQFLQVNPSVNQQMLETALAWLQPRDHQILYDLFCGAGNFSLAFANRVKRIKGYEGVYSMVKHAQENAKLNGLSNCDFEVADLSDVDVLSNLEIEENSLLILDPSREGAQALCKKLATVKVAKILYVSCSPTSFDRDLGYLVPHYKVDKIAAVDMFPFTKHLELMALLTPL